MALPYTDLEHLLQPRLVGPFGGCRDLDAAGDVAREVAAANFAYGYVKALTYLARRGHRGPSSDLQARPVGLAHAELAGDYRRVLIAGSALTGSDVVRGYLGNKPTLPVSYLSLSRVANDVPEGSTVYIENPAHTYGDLVKAATLAYFLPDRDVRIYSGTLWEGTFPDQDTRARPCAYDYVISAHGPGAVFLIVDRNLGPNLRVYQRIGPRCSVS